MKKCPFLNENCKWADDNCEEPCEQAQNTINARDKTKFPCAIFEDDWIINADVKAWIKRCMEDMPIPMSDEIVNWYEKWFKQFRDKERF